jgi:hypothetical protein
MTQRASRPRFTGAGLLATAMASGALLATPAGHSQEPAAAHRATAATAATAAATSTATTAPTPKTPTAEASMLANPAPIPATANAALRTTAERSGYLRTGRYAEVAALCAAYARTWPKQVRCFSFGTSPEGRPLWALVASADGTLTAATNHAKARPVVVWQGGIHAGEIDGKDAGFAALNTLLQESAGGKQNARLRHTTVLFVPVFNVDGHERFGAWQRPNQRGPEEMGWRTTAQNLNLNRDYLKADAPEMRAMLALLRDWDPVIYADLHVTDGADFRHDISVQVEPALGNEPGLQPLGMKLRSAVLADLAGAGSLPLPYYPSLVKDDDPTSGFAVDVAPPRFSHGYWGLHGRFGVLVETHSWKDYATRVRATYHTVLSLTAQAAEEGRSWLQAFRAAEQRDAALGGQPVVLAWKTGEPVTPTDFLGYAYTRTPSAVSGALVTRYDATTPALWQVPLRDTVEPAVTVTAPRGGYLVPAAYAERVRTRLELHGVGYQVLSREGTAQAGQHFHATEAKSASASFEGRVTLALQGDWRDTPVVPKAGDLFVPIAQPRARVLMSLLEPMAPDALVRWGEFSAAFERKEYMEAYVAEQVAVAMLAKDPALAAEFAKKLDTEPAFAASPEARLDFFYWRHAAADQRYRVYPVVRLEAAP